jgi:hypothetical protein
MPKKIVLEVQPLGKKKKGKPRGRAFAKGNELAAKKGEVRNPWGCGGKTRQVKLLSEAYRIGLQDLAPESFAKAVGMQEATWAEVISRGMLQSAYKGEVSAAKEIREVTEGKTPETVYLSGGKDKDGEALPIATTTTLNIHFVDPPDKV